VILSDVLKDKRKYPELSGDWRLALATRTQIGDNVPDGMVKVLDIGEFQIDVSAEEIDILPTCFMTEGTLGLKLYELLAIIEASPELADFQLSGVTGVKHLADGGRAQRSNAIVGSYLQPESQEYWLLLAPESQWPPHWFVT
jgi:hypothetical protein